MTSAHSFHSTHSQIEERSRIHLPKIHQKRPSVGDDDDDNEYYENPFYVPHDEEIFKLKNKEKEIKAMERAKSQSLKIWQKGIKHNSEGVLRKIKELANFEDDQNEDPRLNIVEAAKSAMKHRIRHKEPVLSFLNKKRDMFLFQMSINQKKEQIKEFEELAHLQEVSIQNARDMLETDAEVFKQHVEKNKNETRQAIKKAEDETKEKQKKIQEMKRIQEQISSLSSQNTKKLEKLEKLYGYKTFLDKLTPDDFLKNQKKLKADRRKARSLSPEKVSQKGSRQRKEEFKWESYNINLPQGVRDLLNDSDDENETYFKKSDQLQQFFENLEEKNLFIIKHNQDIEQSLEDLKHSFAAKQADLLERERVLRKNKQELEKAINQRVKGIKQLHVKDDKFTEKTLDKLEQAINVIYEKCKFIKEGRSDQKMSGVDILAQLERRLETQFKELMQFNPQKVLEQYRLCINKRREEANEQKKKQIEEEQKLKMEIVKKRFMTEKRYGRPIMARSMLKTEGKEEVVVEEEDQDEVDKKLYFTKRFF